MKATSNIQPFAFEKSILHIRAQAGASLLEPPFDKAQLGALDGRLLSTFPLARAGDAHPETWEMHPAGDEVLFMLTGALVIDYWTEGDAGTFALEAGAGVVMPQGVWPRLALREPGVLLALTAAHGTESRADKGGRP